MSTSESPALPPKPRPSSRIRLLYWFRRLVPPLSREDRGTTRVQLRQASKPDFDFFFLVAMSSVIATLGLITDSAAVIIGAMLVAPLMSPILGLSLASITGDGLLFRDAVSAVLRGMFFAVGMAWLLTSAAQMMPFNPIINLSELPGEVISRTRPSPFDLGIAIAGGMAAAFALAQPMLSAALPGVAIATALMPPLCTVGVGLALGDWPVAAGAMLLFLTNLAAIAFAGLLTFFALGFRPRGESFLLRRIPRSLVISALLVAMLTVPLAYVSASFVREGSQDLRIRQAVQQAAQDLNAELISTNIDRTGETLHLEITLRSEKPYYHDDVRLLQTKLATELQMALSIAVSVIPSARLDPLVPPTFTPTRTPGPTPTPTVTPSPTATNSPTPKPTSTPTDTPTSTPTATPALLRVENANLPGLVLRASPFGAEIGRLQAGSQLIRLPGYLIEGGLIWVEVMDAQGQIGWVPAAFTSVITLTPTSTATSTPTSTPAPSLTPGS